MASSQNPTNLMDYREVYRDHAIELHDSSNDESHDSSNDKSHETSNDASHDPSNDKSHDPSNNKSYDSSNGDYSPRIQSPEDSLPDLIEYREVYRDHAIELHDSSNDESHDSSNDALYDSCNDESHHSSNDKSHDPSNDKSHDSSNDEYSPRIQIPEDSLPDLYSNCELENAILCLLDDDKDKKWYRLKYKLGVSRDNKEAESIRRKMQHCMFDVHSSEWCQVPLIANTPSVSIQMDSEDSTSSANYKPVDERSDSSPVISDEKTSSDAAVSESDDDIKESDDCPPKNSTVQKTHQKGYEETEIDFNSEPEYPSLAWLYLL